MAPFTKTLELRWSDVDQNGHVRHSIYSDLGAEARIAWLSEGGFPWQRFVSLGLGPVLLREELEFRREISLGDRVAVDVRAAGLSPDGARWKLAHDLTRSDGTLAARITVLGGWLDHASRRLVPPPAELLAIFGHTDRTSDFEELPSLERRK